MASHCDALALWRPLSDLSNDLRAEGVEIGVSGVGMWNVREDIPALYWPVLVKIAAQRDLRFADGSALTVEWLASSQKRLRTREVAAQS